MSVPKLAKAYPAKSKATQKAQALASQGQVISLFEHRLKARAIEIIRAQLKSNR